jgi:hypothetical protein
MMIPGLHLWIDTVKQGCTRREAEET